MATKQLFTNNASSLLAGNITDVAVTLTVTATEGGKFPSPATADEYFLITIAVGNSFEVVKCTSRTADVLTIVRGQEGTTAQGWSIGALVELRYTKGPFSNHENFIYNLQQSTGSSLVGSIQSGTGAVSTDVQTQLRKSVFASDYGSKMTTTPGADINAAITYLNGVGGGTVFVDRGSFTVETSILLLSNVTLEGAGRTATTLTAKAALNAPVMKNSDTSSGNTAVFVRHLKIDGNASNQSSGDRSGLVFQKVTYSGIENVWVNNVKDWGFGIYQGDYISLKDCMATAIVGINDSNGVRAGYLFGTSSTLRLANNITVENCVARDFTDPYVDGFICEQGTGIVLRGCIAKNITYGGIKLNTMSNAYFIGNQVENCLVGFQKLNSGSNVAFIGNLAYRNSGAGFLIGNIDTGNIAKGLILHGNISVDNGQNAYSALYGASGTRYGFAFEGTASATTDRISIKDNVCIDNGGGTQGRGISFAANGTFSNVFMGGNFCKGNTVDLYAFPTTIGAGSDSLQWSTFTNGGNVGFTSGSYTASHPMSVRRFNFWIDNLAAAAGTTNLSDGFSGRGYVVPRAGYLRSLGVKSNAAITAGSATFRVAVNGVAVTALDTVLDSTHTPFVLTEVNIQVNVLAAGDMITVTCSSSAGLLPAGTADFDAEVEIIY